MEESQSTTGRLLKRAVVGLTAVGIAGWLWGRSKQHKPGHDGNPDA